VSGPDRETVVAATAFLRTLREGLDAGLELPEAVVRSTRVLLVAPAVSCAGWTGATSRTSGASTRTSPGP
jgi:hypothetical protein